MVQLAKNTYGITPQSIGIPASTTSLPQGIANAIGLLGIIVGMVSVIAVIYGSFLLASSIGNPKRVQQGRDTIIYAGVGIIVAIAAYAIVFYINSQIK